jgi:hypothetical protein
MKVEKELLEATKLYNYMQKLGAVPTTDNREKDIETQRRKGIQYLDDDMLSIVR